MQEQLFEAFSIMVTGMVTVFVFLVLLMAAMLVLKRFAAEPFDAESNAMKAAATPTPIQSADDTQRLAAITAAVHAYRHDHESAE
ncbi:hypothetical protein IDAT_06660 [Pseudidiomarina atlantica]|jgi:oxaloacetate decarboxylase gamma subunit|uniref:Oxaloacetate decarboxylase gamma chain n=1 Tax=Pseudidiomarina atlantica TaxID=1517416 RepID=A0A094IP52_9GAMM|nr:OadG family protein [Pseudidiomarina atlantica]KFZ28877.1 hypothetical protein IDAT_06660 [Pseudidiomarina atlantica]